MRGFFGRKKELCYSNCKVGIGGSGLQNLVGPLMALGSTHVANI